MNTFELRGTIRQRGFVMSELIVAITIALAAMAGIAQLMYQVARQHRAADQRTIVVQEVTNVMEDLMSRSWSEITADASPTIEPSSACKQTAPDARLNVELVPMEAEDAVRVTVRIDWPADDVRRKEPFQLVAWRYKP